MPLYHAEHGKHSTAVECRSTPLHSTALYSVERRGFTPQTCGEIASGGGGGGEGAATGSAGSRLARPGWASGEGVVAVGGGESGGVVGGGVRRLRCGGCWGGGGKCGLQSARPASLLP